MIISNKKRKSLIAITMIAMTGLVGNAADLITAPKHVSPADGSIGGMFGQISINWEGVTLEMENRDKDALPSEYDYIDPSFLNINVNGKDISVDNTQTGGRIFLKVIQESMEQEGNGEGESLDVLFIDFPTLFPDAYFTWKGEVKVNIKEGAVTATTGEVNGDIELTYYFMDIVNDVTWEPAQDNKFSLNNCIIAASWSEGEVTGLNSLTLPFLQMEDPDNDRLGQQIPLNDYTSISNGKLQFDLSSFEAGVYSLTLPEGSVIIGENYINSEAYYNFTITNTVDAPNANVRVLPSQKDWFDAFSLMWGSPNAPYLLSSDYAESGVINAEGLELITVKENGVELIEVLGASLVEYQEEENSSNYPSAQLNVTLADIQMSVGSRYTLIIEPGLVNININGTLVPNEEVSYTFTLESGDVFVLPEPTINPLPGDVESLETIEISWEATLGGLDLLNINKSSLPMTVTLDGEAYEEYTTDFIWSDSNAVTDGAAGDIFQIVFENSNPGEYVINIPAGYLQVSDIEKGSYESQEINLSYTVVDTEEEPGDGPSGISGIVADENGHYNIYNLKGVKILSTKNVSDLYQLPAGIYIINSKKVILK